MEYTPAIYVKNLTVSYNRRPVLWNITVDVMPGSITALVGPNGAGKSTFMKAVLNIIPRLSGDIRILGNPYNATKHLVSYMPQKQSVDWDFPISVKDLAMMGNYSSVGMFRPFTKKHKEKTLDALAKVDMLPFADRQIRKISGGQQQRAFLARALVQDAPIYFMDEPFAGVDAATEKAILNVLLELKKKNKTVVLVHHDVNTVKEYFDNVIMINLVLIAAGVTKTVFTDDNLSKTYKGKLTLLDNVSSIVASKYKT